MKRKNKIAIIGDIHFGLTYRGMEWDNRIEKNLEFIINKLSETKDLLKIFILGDLFHNGEMNVDIFMKVIGSLGYIDSLGVEVNIIRGNHDYKTRGSGNKDFFDVMKLIRFKNVRFINEPVLEIENNIGYVLFPYPCGEEEANIIMKQIKGEKLDKCFVFTHHNLYEAAKGTEENMICGKDNFVPQVFLNDKRITKIFNGHYHTPQVIGKVEMPGSIETLQMGEGNRREFLLVEIHED